MVRQLENLVIPLQISKWSRTKDDCKLGGWTGLGRTDGTPFKNSRGLRQLHQHWEVETLK